MATTRFISTADRLRYQRDKREREESPIVMVDECCEPERYEKWIEAFNAKIDPRIDVDQRTYVAECKFSEQRIVVDVSDVDFPPRDFHGTKRWKVLTNEGEFHWNAIQSYDESYEVGGTERKYFAVYYVVKV